MPHKTPSRRPANPPWTRDELIVALDLYLRLGGKVADESHPEVIAASELLNSLPIHEDRPDAGRFRNANGVALKLANFRAVEQPGHGMSRGNALEKVVWQDFARDPARLRAVAVVIATQANAVAPPESRVPPADYDEELAFPEGRIAFRVHRARERSGSVIRKKKQQALQAGPLRCEVCAFDFEARYGAVGREFIEVHHTVAISDLGHGGTTRLRDLALVCANCHRMLHRRRPWLSLADLARLLNPVGAA